jgi:hypothetical protein
MPKFMLILSSRPGVLQALSPEELQRKMEKYHSWADKLRANGRYVSGEKLGDDGGRILAQKGGRLSIVDGPFADAKEVVGGFMLLRAASYDEALDLTRDCPMLEEYTLTIRETDPSGCGGD